MRITTCMFVFTCIESLFGAPPFASKTLEELEIKLLDTKPVEVSTHTV